MKFKKSLARFAVVASIAAGCVSIAPAAHAGGYGCSGSQIDSYTVKTSGGTQYGTIFLYYDSSTGKNCAASVRTSAGGYGTSAWMNVNLYKCAETTPGNGCTTTSVQDHDAGNYAYYAGPVEVSAAGHCISVDSTIKRTDGSLAQRWVNTGVHCG